jgi:UDP-GlcNAc:undecaprenyl-phosphate GlcNAc-1-phosphate transferase
MGDAGSLFLGFILSSMAILFTAQPYDLVGFITPLVVISIPILDTALAILRRLARRTDPFTGDRQHVYDLLARKGLGNRRAVLVIYLAAFLLGALSLVMVRLDPLPAILLAIGVVMIMCIIAMNLGAIRSPVPRKDVDQ